MTLTIKLRQMLHRKSAEYCTPCAAGNTGNGAFFVSDKSDMIAQHDIAYYINGTSSVWNYNADQDAWLQLPNSGLAGTFAAGSCGEFRPISAPGGNITQTSASGSTATLTSSTIINRSLAGCAIRVVGGAGVGYSGTIKSNTLGPGAIITVEPASSVAFNNTTQYQMFGGSLWFFNAGTAAVGFGVYDRASNTWTSRTVAGLPTAWGTDGRLVSTPGFASNGGAGFVSGTAAAGAASTMTLEPGKVFLLNQWANMQLRIVSGTGAGQIRTIASNTAGSGPVVTVAAAWTIAPDATSVYRIEGNDDHFYLLGNNSAVMYRFTVSTNTWATLAPVAARTGAAGAGCTADWIDGVADALWTDGSYGAHHTGLIKQNGRYIYSFRAGGSSALDVYDIAGNTWISGVAYGQQFETFNAGSCSVDLDGFIYLLKEATGRIYRFDVAKNALEPWALIPAPQGAAVAGDKMILTTYKEGGQKLNYLYTLGHTRSELVRWVVV
jgi:hypothetical protein